MVKEAGNYPTKLRLKPTSFNAKAQRGKGAKVLLLLFHCVIASLRRESCLICKEFWGSRISA
jgi:hypothetical protein